MSQCPQVEGQRGGSALKRIILVLAMVAVMVAMLAPPALAASKRFDCYHDDRKPRYDVNKKKAQKLEDRGFRCYRVSS
jgi:hypothetical protein